MIKLIPSFIKFFNSNLEQYLYNGKMNSKSTLVIISIFLFVLLLGFPLLMLSGEAQGKVALDEKLELPFEVKKESRVILLYMGYVGCQTICTPSLQESAEIFNHLDDTSKVSFVFINIAKDGGGAKEFANYFHKEFIGLELSKKETSKLMRTLHAYSSDALVKGGEVYHTGYLYLITQQTEGNFHLKSMYYTRPFDAISISQDIKKELE